MHVLPSRMSLSSKGQHKPEADPQHYLRTPAWRNSAKPLDDIEAVPYTHGAFTLIAQKGNENTATLNDTTSAFDLYMTATTHLDLLIVQ